MTQPEVTAVGMVFGILSGLIGQALFWGIFRGSVTERLNSQRRDLDKHEARLGQQEHEITLIDRRLIGVEKTCQINHGAEES